MNFKRTIKTLRDIEGIGGAEISPYFAGCIADALEEACSMREVVFCKNCTVPHNEWTGCPKLNGLVTPPDFYCGFGSKDKM